MPETDPYKTMKEAKVNDLIHAEIIEMWRTGLGLFGNLQTAGGGEPLRVLFTHAATDDSLREGKFLTIRVKECFSEGGGPLRNYIKAEPAP